jgi:hypothetical protein
MYYGAALDEPSELRAHLWVRADDIDVLGCDIAHKYAVLMTFSSQSSQHAPPKN